jgi:hypothetical protein
MDSVIHVSNPDQEDLMSNHESPGPVVVGIDGSDAAIGAARWAAKEAVHQDVPLRLVYVIQTTDGPTAWTDAYAAEEAYAERSLRAACLAVEATGVAVKIETAVLRDDVDAGLIAESNKRNPRLRRTFGDRPNCQHGARIHRGNTRRAGAMPSSDHPTH